MKKIFVFSFLFLCISFSNAFASSDKNSDYRENEILVKFKKNFFKTNLEKNLQEFSKTYNLSYKKEENLCQKMNCYFLFRMENPIKPRDEFIEEISKDNLVKFSQPNYVFRSFGKRNNYGISRDRFSKQEWWIYNNGKIGTSGSDIGAAGNWSKEQKSWTDVAIGIIDSGLNTAHTDIKRNIIAGYDFVHSKKKKIQDKDGHGSFIAGLIASEVNNKKGIAGLSRWNNLKIMPLKFDFSTQEAVEAVSFAKSKGIRILNMSWGTSEFDQALYDAIKDYNGLVFAASGNEGLEHTSDHHFYPCDFDLDNIICVAASDENDRLASYSDWSKESVDLVAPGGDEAPLISLDTKKNRYVSGIGSSYATALTSGSAGLILSSHPNYSNTEIKNAILENVRKKPELEEKVLTGGILNVPGAMGL